MSHHNILITGASGYLGGTILAQLGSAGLPAHGTVYALVRSEEQAQAVKQYGAEPLTFDTLDAAAVEQHVVDNAISVIYYLIDAINSDAQQHFIRALAEVKQGTGHDVHFLHVSGQYYSVATKRERIRAQQTATCSPTLHMRLHIPASGWLQPHTLFFSGTQALKDLLQQAF